MRIVTRPDFDGIVCAVLLKAALKIEKEIYWVEPNEIQSGRCKTVSGDIVANLPYSEGCSLWFDHHISNKPDFPIKGAFDIAPSAAGVVYQHYLEKKLLDRRFETLVLNTDIIDSADLNIDQVKYPEKYPYILLSMTISNDNYKDIPYWNYLVELLPKHPIEKIIEDHQVRQRCRQVIDENLKYETYLNQCTKVENKISITDFRDLDTVPNGNRFLSYSLFPETIASVKLRHGGKSRETVQISVGASIFNRNLNVNIGRLLSKFGGGGHAGAGGCTLETETADEYIEQILQVLFANKKEV